MKGIAAISASLLASVAMGQQNGPKCNAVSYDFSAFSGSVTYQSVVKYAFDMGQCKMEPATVKGPIAPLDQGLTAVFRGPLKLKQFAVYNQGAASKKRSAKSSPRERRHHNHERFHKKHAEAEHHEEKRECGQMVTATINGVVQTFPDTWNCGAGSSSGATPAPAAPAAANAPVQANVNVAVAASSSAAPAPAPAASSSAPASGGSSSSSGSSGSSSGGAWNQVSYYSSSSPSKTSNLTFLYPVPYSNTDYLPSNGDTTGKPAAAPEALNDVLIPDNARFYINSGEKMANNPSANNKAYHGFAGNKIFLVEMGMPMSGLRDGSAYPDAPAFWLLNEQIPATSDGSPCSCWKTGCGEFDVHEIITPGHEIGYSTLHMGDQYCGGADNGFARATSGTQKLAVIINAGSSGANSVVRIVQLDDNYNFGSSISESDYQKWVSMPIAGGQKGTVHDVSKGGTCP